MTAQGRVWFVLPRDGRRYGIDLGLIVAVKLAALALLFLVLAALWPHPARTLAVFVQQYYSLLLRQAIMIYFVTVDCFQFALTPLYHFLFVPLTLSGSGRGRSRIMETVYVMTRPRDLEAHAQVPGVSLLTLRWA